MAAAELAVAEGRARLEALTSGMVDRLRGQFDDESMEALAAFVYGTLASHVPTTPSTVAHHQWSMAPLPCDAVTCSLLSSCSVNSMALFCASVSPYPMAFDGLRACLCRQATLRWPARGWAWH